MSGIAFAVLFLFAWFLNSAVTPHYTAPNSDWANEGAGADPVVTKAIATATVGPFLVAPMGFVALLAGAGLVTLRSGVFQRWTGMVALLGAASFLITFLTTLDGTADGSVFGYGFFPGVVALVVWSIATSVASYRAVGPTATSAPVTASQ